MMVFYKPHDSPPFTLIFKRRFVTNHGLVKVTKYSTRKILVVLLTCELTFLSNNKLVFLLILFVCY